MTCKIANYLSYFITCQVVLAPSPRLPRNMPFLLPLSKQQLEETRPLDRVVPVRRDLHEAERAVELLRGAHRRQRVEPHPLIAEPTRTLDRRGGERAADAGAATGPPHVEALHLAHAGLE